MWAVWLNTIIHMAYHLQRSIPLILSSTASKEIGWLLFLLVNTLIASHFSTTSWLFRLTPQSVANEGWPIIWRVCWWIWRRSFWVGRRTDSGWRAHWDSCWSPAMIGRGCVSAGDLKIQIKSNAWYNWRQLILVCC